MIPEGGPAVDFADLTTTVCCYEIFFRQHSVRCHIAWRVHKLRGNSSLEDCRTFEHGCVGAVRCTVQWRSSRLAIFISYAHSDAQFAEKLARQLVQHNAHVWIDRWEINVGESLIQRIQQAIQESSALLIVLSKSSVQSEWCKKELNAALVRELEEKRVIVLPVVAEDCEIPLFLREKRYADFRMDFGAALRDLLSAIAKFTNPDQGRVTSGRVNTDWSESWGYRDGEKHFCMEYTLVESSLDLAFTILTEIFVVCNEAATKRYRKYESIGLDWLGRMIITEALAEFAVNENMRILLKDNFPQDSGFTLLDEKTQRAYDIHVRCKRLGEDNGKDQLVRIANYFAMIRDHAKARLRGLTPTERASLAEVLTA